MVSVPEVAKNTFSSTVLPTSCTTRRQRAQVSKFTSMSAPSAKVPVADPFRPSSALS
jgi:hypothetical protein